MDANYGQINKALQDVGAKSVVSWVMALFTPRLRLLVDEIHRQGPLSNQEIAQLLTLSPASITHLVQPWIQEGLLKVLPPEEYPRQLSKDGELSRRRKATLAINPQWAYAVIVEAHPQYLVFRKVNAALTMDPEFTQTLALDSTASIEEAICTQASKMKAHDPRPLLGLGITVPGHVDPERGEPLWTRIVHDGPGGTASVVSQSIKVPCIVEKDCQALARYERFSGAGRDCNNFAILYINEGTSAGFVIDGRIQQGGHSLTGAVGHISLGLGPQTYDSIVSRPAVYRSLVASGLSIPEHQTWRTLAQGIEGAIPQEAINGQIQQLAQACGTLVGTIGMIVGPEKVWLHGPLGELGERFTTMVRQYMAQSTFPSPTLEARKDWKTAMAIGTARSVWEAVFGPV